MQNNVVHCQHLIVIIELISRSTGNCGEPSDKGIIQKHNVSNLRKIGFIHFEVTAYDGGCQFFVLTHLQTSVEDG